MPITLHVILGFIVSFIGLFGGMFGGFYTASVANEAGVSNGLQMGAFFGVLLAGILIPYFMFRWLIPARCPKCGGAAFPRGRRPIRYHCRSCSHVQVTSFSYGRREYD